MLYFLKFILVLLPILISVAFLTLLERKVLSIKNLRLGPNKVSFWGILQPLGDAVKLMNKSYTVISNSYSFIVYLVSGMSMFFSAIMLWNMFFINPCPISVKFSLLFIFIFLALNCMNSVIVGWSSSSKFALIGSMRTVAQLISYEALLFLCVFLVICVYSSFNTKSMGDSLVQYLFFLLPVGFYSWLPSILAEMNRTPFDFSEGESELVSGFNIEFGSAVFVLIFLAEYTNILFFAFLTSFVFFLGHTLVFFVFFCFLFIWVRAVLPRYRYDKLMDLSWKFFIPFLTLFFCYLVVFMY